MAEPKQGCCPPGSEPFKLSDYTSRGTDGMIEDLPIYTVGEVGEKAIIVFNDPAGPESSLTKVIADQLADAGYFVILSDPFKGGYWKNVQDTTGILEWLQDYSWDKIKDFFDKQIIPYLESKGVKRIGGIGFCWGCYCLFHASASGKLNAGVCCHPSLTIYKETPEEAAELAQCPLLIMPGGNDPPQVREGGSVEKILKAKPFGDKVKVKDFPEMKHGWVNRGDLNVLETLRDHKAALELALQFFKENL